MSTLPCFLLSALLHLVFSSTTSTFGNRTHQRRVINANYPNPSQISTSYRQLRELPKSSNLSNPSLAYNTTDGRFRVITNIKPTVSVYWDKIAQDLAADQAQGPTLASAAYVLMHSAIFDAWRTYRYSEPQWWTKHNRWRRHRNVRKFWKQECSLKRLTMHYAAYFALVRSFPRRQTAINRALHVVEKRCLTSPHRWRAKQAARHIAGAAFWRYNSEVYHAEQFNELQQRSSIEIWKPERIPIDSEDGSLQVELTPSWGLRYTFGIRNGGAIDVPEPKRFLLVEGKFDMESRTVSFPNGTTVEFSTSLLNPEFLKQAQRVVDASAASTPLQRFTAEAWEAGTGSSYPPGAWLTITQWVSARTRNDDDEDAGLFFAVSNALSDAGVATWLLKYRYRYARPVRVIRDLGELGLLDNLRLYDPSTSSFKSASAEEFTTYQKPGGEPSPSFPEYTSGHSAFSSAAAEVLRQWSGSDNFGAGVSLRALESRFEKGRAPATDLNLYWKTFTDAANEAGMSRIYGGIHFDDANVQGLRLGRRIGAKAFQRARFLFSGKPYGQ